MRASHFGCACQAGRAAVGAVTAAAAVSLIAGCATDDLAMVAFGAAFMAAVCATGGAVWLRATKSPATSRLAFVGARELGPLAVQAVFNLDGEILVCLGTGGGRSLFLAWHPASRKAVRHQWALLNAWERDATAVKLVTSPGHPAALVGGNVATVLPEIGQDMGNAPKLR